MRSHHRNGSVLLLCKRLSKKSSVVRAIELHISFSLAWCSYILVKRYQLNPVKILQAEVEKSLVPKGIR